MTPTLSKKLKKIYYRYKDGKNPPVPIKKLGNVWNMKE